MSASDDKLAICSPKTSTPDSSPTILSVFVTTDEFDTQSTAATSATSDCCFDFKAERSALQKECVSSNGGVPGSLTSVGLLGISAPAQSFIAYPSVCIVPAYVPSVQRPALHAPIKRTPLSSKARAYTPGSRAPMAPRMSLTSDSVVSSQGATVSWHGPQQFCGTWKSEEDSRYTIKEMTDGALRYEQRLSSGEHVSAILRFHGRWLQGDVLLDDTDTVGSICFRVGDIRNTLVSTFKPAADASEESGSLWDFLTGGDSHGFVEPVWGPERLARIEEEEPSPGFDSQTCERQRYRQQAQERSHDSESQRSDSQPFDLQAYRRYEHNDSCATSEFGTPVSYVGESIATDVPVKRTFIHFGDPIEIEPCEEGAVRSSSAPPTLVRRPFMLKSDMMALIHAEGGCKPCAYFWEKTDGCRWGNQCRFCHLCSHGEVKKRRKEKDRMLRLKAQALALTNATL